MKKEQQQNMMKKSHENIKIFLVIFPDWNLNSNIWNVLTWIKIEFSYFFSFFFMMTYCFSMTNWFDSFSLSCRLVCVYVVVLNMRNEFSVARVLKWKWELKIHENREKISEYNLLYSESCHNSYHANTEMHSFCAQVDVTVFFVSLFVPTFCPLVLPQNEFYLLRDITRRSNLNLLPLTINLCRQNSHIFCVFDWYVIDMYVFLDSETSSTS